MKSNYIIFVFISVIVFSIVGAVLISTQNLSSTNTQFTSQKTTTSQYKIGAYYFGTYSKNHPEWALDFYEQTFGKRDPWAAVKTFYGNEPGYPENQLQWDNEDFSHLKPSIGYYDNSEVSVVEKHIMQAKQNGLDYFNFYWYWNSYEDTEFINDGLDTFLMARNSKDLNFMLAVIANDGDNGRPYLPVNDAGIDIIVNKYLARSNYLKTPTGQPIILLMGPGTIAQLDETIAKLKTKAQEKLNITPYILINGDIPYSNDAVNNDGIGCHAPYGFGNFAMEGNAQYSDYISRIIPYSNIFSRKPFMNCVISNFDERPRVLGRAEQFQDPRYYTDYSKEMFRTALQTVKSEMDSRSDIMSKYMTVYAWNEWDEGGIIEPNVRDGSYYLKTISEVFSLPRSSDPCRDTGTCNPFSCYDTALGSLKNTEVKVGECGQDTATINCNSIQRPRIYCDNGTTYQACRKATDANDSNPVPSCSSSITTSSKCSTRLGLVNKGETKVGGCGGNGCGQYQRLRVYCDPNGKLFQACRDENSSSPVEKCN